MTKPENRPKGSMCMSCTKAWRYCGDLDFNSMPIIGRDNDGTAVVRCTAYKKDSSLPRKQ